MMPSLLNTNMVGGVSQHLSHTNYATDAMLDELSRQLAAANTRRLSRGSGSQRMGNAMRIVKPGSANNSPRSSMQQSRRRTLITDGLQGRPHLQPVDVNNYQQPNRASELAFYEQEKRPARPVSWHPETSHQLPQLQSHQYQLPHYSQQQEAPMPYAFSNYSDAELFAGYQQFPPTPAAYSGYASPSSTFSPLSLPYSSIGSQQYYSPTNNGNNSNHHQSHLPPPQLTPPSSSYPPSHNSQSPVHGPAATTAPSSTTLSDVPYLPPPRGIGMTTTSSNGGVLDWDAFAAQGFDRYGAPPTPEDFVVQSPQAKASNITTTVTALPMPTKVQDDEAPSYEDDDSDGEILYGMGLYDVPERDPVLDFHHSAVFSLLGGSSGSYPEPTGKGLKLEDAWEPPASDSEDEDGEGGDGDDDADGDADDDEDL